MITENINLIKLTATEGFVLTDGEAYGKEVYLGCNDSPENWHEITDAEYEEILKENEKRMKEAMEDMK